MNYNPYLMMAPLRGMGSMAGSMAGGAARPGLLSLLTRGIGRSGLTLSTVVDGTHKTLGLINQAIPVVKQVSPVVKNARTMFKVMNEFKKDDTGQNNGTVNHSEGVSKQHETKQSNYDAGPKFFV